MKLSSIKTIIFLGLTLIVAITGQYAEEDAALIEEKCGSYLTAATECAATLDEAGKTSYDACVTCGEIVNEDVALTSGGGNKQCLPTQESVCTGTYECQCPEAGECGDKIKEYYKCASYQVFTVNGCARYECSAAVSVKGAAFVAAALVGSLALSFM